MKATAREDVRIRKTHLDLEVPPIGMLFAGTTLEVEDALYTGAAATPQPHPRATYWLRDLNGWYYWAGAMDFDEQQIAQVVQLPPEQAEAAEWDYNQRLVFVPEAWRNTQGRGITIAVIDTGFVLRHPVLKHLARPGSHYDLTKAGFAERPGNDPVASRSTHGTEVLSLLAARPSATFPLGGIAPQARYLLLKVADRAGRILPAPLLDALEFALDPLDADIISVSVSLRPSLLRAPDRKRLQRIGQKLVQRRTLLFAALPNPGQTYELLTARKLKVPATLPPALRTGAISETFFAHFHKKKFDPEIHILANQLPIACCSGTEIKMTPLSSSYATPLMAGIAALAMAHHGGRRALCASATDEDHPSAFRQMLRDEGVVLPLQAYENDELLFLDPHWKQEV